MGPADELARQIIRSHQTTKRLLAAAGGGTLSAVSGAFRGAVVATVASLVAFVVYGLLRSALPDALWISDALRAPLLLFGLWVIAYSAGRVTPLAVATISARSMTWSRQSVALVGGIAVFWFFWFVFETQMPAWAAPGFGLTPLAFLIGVARSTERRWLPTDLGIRTFVALNLVAIGMFASSLIVAPKPVELTPETDPDESSLVIVGDVSGIGDIYFRRRWAEADPVVTTDHSPTLRAYSSVRIETWKATSDLHALDRAADAPIYSAEFRAGVLFEGGSIGGWLFGMPFVIGAHEVQAFYAPLDLTARRDWSPQWLVFVGITHDGRREVLGYAVPDIPRNLHFFGTFAEWLIAK
jgi:hypothetical protein